MPNAPPRICSRCSGLVPHGARCPCNPSWDASTQPGATPRVGGRRWRRAKAAQLVRQPFCQWHDGCGRLATRVDHIVPLAEGGSEFDPANQQSLCATHDDEKTQGDALRGRTRSRG